MTLPFDDHGLPLPGRELDEAIAKLLGYEVVEFHYEATSDTYVLVDMWDKCWLVTPSGRTSWQVSTTHAFFQVMEALSPEYIWLFREDSCGIGVAMRPIDCDGRPGSFWECNLNWGDKKDREKLYAHAVCCCAWKAMGGENA